MKNKKFLKVLFVGTKCVICISLIVPLLILFAPLGGIASIVLEGTLVKWNINNPYVNNGLDDWKMVPVSGFADIHIPDNWELSEKNGVITIVDENGTVFARGTIFETDNDRFESITDFVRWLISSDECDVTLESYAETCNMEGSSIGKLQITGTAHDSCYFALITDQSAEFPYPELFLVIQQTSEESLDVSEAMIYAFSYIH